MLTNKFHYIVGAFGLVLAGCFGHPNHPRDAATGIEREIDDSLDGIEYRLQRLRSTESSDKGTRETLQELRRHREELRKELDHAIASHDTLTDSVETDLRERIQDLAVRYETARLGRFETRESFQRAVDARFEDLDRELAFLEGDVIRQNLTDFFEETIARLYRLRNDVALLVAETSTAPEKDFPRFKGELAAAIGRLDIMLADATIEVDRASEAKHPVRSIRRLWL